MEDIMSMDQRPKVEDYEKYLYLVLKMLTTGRNGEIVTEQISIVLGPNFVLSFQEGIEGDVFNAIRERLRAGKGRIRKAGADYLAYSLIDAIVDNYFVVLEKFGDRIEYVETELIENPTQQTVQKIYQLKRELIFLHNAVWPLREVVSALGKQESDLIREVDRALLPRRLRSRGPYNRQYGHLPGDDIEHAGYVPFEREQQAEPGDEGAHRSSRPYSCRLRSSSEYTG